jgi:chemotaxis protein MotB
MNKTRLFGFFVPLAILTLAVGCEKDQRIRQLEAKNQALMNSSVEMRQQLELVQQDRDGLDGQLRQRENALAEERQFRYAAEAEAERWRAYAEGIEQAPVSNPPTGWESTAGGDRVTLGSDILFSPGSATLTAKGKSALDQISRDIAGSYGGRSIRVFGHTDSDPIVKTKAKWDDNLDLSANRAMAVTRYLTSKGLDAANVETVGMGAAQPVASNGSKDGKARNRRVEIYAVQ